MSRIDITVFSKADGPLTKKIELGPNGNVVSDGSACVMSRGTARRFGFDRLQDFAELIEKCASHEAITLGGLRPGLPDQVEVTTKRQLNGADDPAIIARTKDFVIYRPSE